MTDPTDKLYEHSTRNGEQYTTRLCKHCKKAIESPHKTGKRPQAILFGNMTCPHCNEDSGHTHVIW
jgi:hypothetical protein